MLRDMIGRSHGLYLTARRELLEARAHLESFLLVQLLSSATWTVRKIASTTKAGSLATWVSMN